MTRKQQVVALLKSLETGDGGPVAVINPDKYIQHNLGAADGLAGLRALLQAHTVSEVHDVANRQEFHVAQQSTGRHRGDQEPAR